MEIIKLTIGNPLYNYIGWGVLVFFNLLLLIIITVGINEFLKGRRGL